MTQKQQAKLALLIALELRFGAKSLPLRYQLELKYLIQEFHRCRITTSNV